MEHTASFGYWLRRRRKALDLTQDELARQVGCAVSTIKKLEGDERRPSRQMAARLADLLAIPPSEHDAFLKAARAELATHHLAITAEPIDLSIGSETAPTATPRSTLSLLFTDIEGSTRLWERHPEGMRAALIHHDAILRHTIQAHRGHVFKTVGDAFYATFATATDALAAALQAQRTLAAVRWTELTGGAPLPSSALVAPPALRVRIALHTGAVEQRDGDYFGHALSRVARILAASHGGQTLLSAATWELVRDQLPPDVTLRDLGTHWLRSLPRPERLFQIVVPDLPAIFPPLAVQQRPLSNLPVPLTAIVGRERELEEVAALLRRSDVRLLTLTGPGGTGKTRLAVEAVTRRFADEPPEGNRLFPHGVWFVDLAPISDPALVAATIAQALGVRDPAGRPPIDGLKDYLRERRLLLVLDNFEQVADAAPVVAELLATAPGLIALVTSRVALHLSGERTYAVPPLQLPDRAQATSLAQLTQYDAVQLFIERAQAMQHDFTVTNATAPAVAEICQRLDGLPLAIELAAARIKLFPPQALLLKLDDRLRFLTGKVRDLPARQQTIRNTIDWSYQLLTSAEQRLFARLGVFVGSWTLAAAEAVCGGAGDGALEVVDGVELLLDKSLLRQSEGSSDEPRFVLLETVREYALERLIQSGEAAVLWRRYAEYVRDLVVAAERGVQSPEERRWRDMIEAERLNIHAALRWSLEDGDPNLGAAILVNLREMWINSAEDLELFPWVERALGRGAAIADVLRASLYRMWAGYHVLRGNLALAQQVCEEGVALARAAGERHVIGRMLIYLGTLLSFTDGTLGLLQLEEGSALCREIGDRRGYIYGLKMKRLIASFQSQHEYFVALTDEIMGLCQQVGQPSSIAEEYNSLGELARAQGDYSRARRMYEQSIALYRSITHHYPGDVTIDNLGFVCLRLGDVQSAEACFRATLTMARERGLSSSLPAYSVAGMAGVLLLSLAPHEDARPVVRLLGAAQHALEQNALGLEATDAADFDWLAATARALLGEEPFAIAWAEGRAMTQQQVLDALSDETARGI